MADAKQVLNPWERQPGEGAEAFEALGVYLNQGPARTLATVARSLGKHPSLIRRWSSHWRWSDRSEAFDTHAAIVRQRAIDQKAAESAAVWAKRRLDDAEQAWQAGAKLMNRGMAMLDHPLTTKRLDKDGKTIIVIPSKWSFASAARLVKDGCQLQGLACDLALESDDFDPMTATPEECREYVRSKAQRQADVKAILDRESE